MAYNLKDFYFKKAKKENYAARSAFKLEEIDERFGLLKASYKVLDLGAAPGSWSQYCSRKLGNQGRILGIDLQEVKITLPNAVFITADIRDLDLEKTMAETGIAPPFDCVISDMAPRTTGIRITDQVRSYELCEIALGAANRFLRKNGHFVVKFFHSDEFPNLRKQMLQLFERVEILRPQSTRKESKEIFLIGLKFKGQTPSLDPGQVSKG